MGEVGDQPEHGGTRRDNAPLLRDTCPTDKGLWTVEHAKLLEGAGGVEKMGPQAVRVREHNPGFQPSSHSPVSLQGPQ